MTVSKIRDLITQTIAAPPQVSKTFDGGTLLVLEQDHREVSFVTAPDESQVFFVTLSLQGTNHH